MKRFLPIALLATSLCSPQLARAAEAIQWPIPWKTGSTWTYENETIEDEIDDGERVKTREADITRIRIVEASADGYVQEWTTRDTTYEILLGDDRIGELFKPAIEALEAISVLAEFDRTMVFTGIRNLDDVSSRMKAVLAPPMKRLAMTSAAEALEGMDERDIASARAELEATLDSVIQQSLTDTMIESLVSDQMQEFNLPMGMTLIPGETRRVETTLLSPVIDQRIPALVEYRIALPADMPRHAIVTWTAGYHPETSLPILLNIAEEELGASLSDAQRLELQKQRTMKVEGSALFHLDTGAIERFESKKAIDFLNTTSHSRTRMRLIDGDHRHEWPDTDAPASDRTH